MIQQSPESVPLPSEIEIGLGRGRLGDWMQEVADAGWTITIAPYDDDAGMGGGVSIGRPGSVSYWGMDDDRHDVEMMFARAWMAWRARDT